MPKGNISYVTDYHTVNPINVPVHEPVKRRQFTKIGLHEKFILFPCTCSTNAMHRIGQQSFYLHVSKPFHHVHVHKRVQESIANAELLKTEYTCNYFGISIGDIVHNALSTS